MSQELPFKKLKIANKNAVEVTVCGDANDGDYITESSVVDIKDFVKLYPYLDDLLPSGTGDCSDYTEDEEDDLSDPSIPNDIRELFENCIDIPYGENGCHSIHFGQMIYFDENGVGWDIE